MARTLGDGHETTDRKNQDRKAPRLTTPGTTTGKASFFRVLAAILARLDKDGENQGQSDASSGESR